MIRRIFNSDPMHHDSNHLCETAVVERFLGVVLGALFGISQQLEMVHVLV